MAGCHGRPRPWCSLIVLVSGILLPAIEGLDYTATFVNRHSYNTV